MTPLIADIVGLCGSVIFIGAFGYANVSPSMDKVLFNVLYLIGAILLLMGRYPGEEPRKEALA